MVRLEATADFRENRRTVVAGDVNPAGESPVSVSAGAPSSRPQACIERYLSQAGCQKPEKVREQPCRLEYKVKSAASTKIQWESRATHIMAKAKLSGERPGCKDTGSLPGVWELAGMEGFALNWRGPSTQPMSGKVILYKPEVKSV